MVVLADIRPGQQVLEPSAGTGRIIDAIRRNAHGYAITAVELNCKMAHRLRTVDCVDDTRQADFLECNGDLGTFDRIVMNPPFANADDIKHIMHALKMLKPGGRLVAICANGPRQNDKLRPLVEARGGIWEELPSATFIGAGTCRYSSHPRQNLRDQNPLNERQQHRKQELITIKRNTEENSPSRKVRDSSIEGSSQGLMSQHIFCQLCGDK
jgi:SAM-dependent methyltransferase